MNLVTMYEQYNPRYVFFYDATKNTIIPNGNFIRIFYSNNEIILNGIYLYVSIVNCRTEKYYNKYKCFFNKQDNIETIHQLKQFEGSLLDKYYPINKVREASLSNMLDVGYIKTFSDTDTVFQPTMNYILKVSGIWENPTEYGITYKFIPVSH